MVVDPGATGSYLVRSLWTSTTAAVPLRNVMRRMCLGTVKEQSSGVDEFGVVDERRSQAGGVARVPGSVPHSDHGGNAGFVALLGADVVERV